MVLPINGMYGRVNGMVCIFCGKDCSYLDEIVEIRDMDGRRKMKRRFHRSCFIKNAQESKRMKYAKV